jgi:hypothetical protein
MQPAQHMCMRSVIPHSRSHWDTCAMLSLTHWGTRAVISLSHAVVVSLALRHVCCSLSLLHCGMRTVFPLSCMQLCSLSRIGACALCSHSLLHATGRAGGGVGRSNRRKKIKRRCGGHQAQQHTCRRSSIRGRPDMWIRPDVRALE